MSHDPDDPRRPLNDEFEPTQWSLVLRAGDKRHPGTEAALAEICRRYWTAVYAYVRRRTRDVHRAQDLTQAFFTRLLERNLPGAADPQRGRFRAFLLTAVRNFLANEHERTTAECRGGRARALSFDFDDGESRLRIEPEDEATPEHLFERQWALTLLDLVLKRLEAEHATPERRRQFEVLKPALVGGQDRLPFAELAAQLNVSEEAARQAASRLRRRYRDLLRSEIAATLADPAEVDDEIGRLFEVLGRS